MRLASVARVGRVGAIRPRLAEGTASWWALVLMAAAAYGIVVIAEKT